MSDNVEDINKTVQKKCPSCGASDISLDIGTGKLKCNYCGREFVAEQIGEDKTKVEDLYGENFSIGISDLPKGEGEIITLKCDGCGAEITINKSELAIAKCHWCGSALSVSQKIANGNIPDMILPFKVTKQEAKDEMNKFIGKKRKRYALNDFVNNLKEDNIKGVYFPYMIIDINSHAKFSGRGEITTRRYTVEIDDNREETRYDAELYDIKREFDVTMKNLTIEANADKFDTQAKDKTNNIINAILPFDIDNCVEWDPNYLRGFTLEKRDLNVNHVNILVDEEAKDIARYKVNETLKRYDRGVRWEKEDLSIKGTRWKLAYMPVWLYNYRETDKKGNIVQNYIAVNARTKETMGSVPMNKKKYLIDTCLIGLIASILLLLVMYFTLKSFYIFNTTSLILIFLLFVVFSIVNYRRKIKIYRNPDERHYHEKDTKSEMFNMISDDRFVKKENGLDNPKMKDANNTKVYSRTNL